MKFNIGVKVRFLNDVGGGEVVKILSKTMVLVRDSSDFEYPLSVNEIVLIESGNILQEKTEKNKKITESKDIDKIQENFDDEIFLKNDNKTNIYFAFCRKKTDDEDGFETFLINDSDFTLHYLVFIRGDEGWKLLDSEILEPNTKILVAYLNRETINISKEIVIQMMFSAHPVQVYHEMIERRIKIVPLELFQEFRYKPNEFLDENAYVLFC